MRRRSWVENRSIARPELVLVGRTVVGTPLCNEALLVMELNCKRLGLKVVSAPELLGPLPDSKCYWPRQRSLLRFGRCMSCWLGSGGRQRKRCGCLGSPA